MMQALADLIFRVASILLAAGIAIIIFWICDRRSPIEIVGSNIIPEPAYPGDTLDFGWQAVSHFHGCKITFRRRVEDPSGKGTWIDPIDRTSGYGELPIGKVHYMHTTQPFILPRVSPGIAQVFLMFKSYCNPIHVIFNWPVGYIYESKLDVGSKQATAP